MRRFRNLLFGIHSVTAKVMAAIPAATAYTMLKLAPR